MIINVVVVTNIKNKAGKTVSSQMYQSQWHGCFSFSQGAQQDDFSLQGY
jgi:hypothetical protein